MINAKQKAEARGKSLQDLKKRVIELKRELMNLRFQKAGGSLEKTHNFKLVRREIAFLNTLITEKSAK